MDIRQSDQGASKAVPPTAHRPSGRPRFALFDSFRIRSFRFQWSADGLSTWASEMEVLILGWYVLVATDSPFMVGLLGALRFTGTLLGPLYGILVDRFDRRRLQISLRLFFTVLAAILMILALTGTLEVWHAFVVMALAGGGRMFDNVVRQALLADVVPRSSLMNAVGLQRSMMDGTKIAGALLAGALLARVGLGQAYIGVTVLYLASSLLAVGITITRRSERSSAGMLSQLGEGLRYMRRNETIAAAMFLAFLVNLTVFPLANGLMPVVARETFGFGPQGLALLSSTLAAGALAGSIGLAAFSQAGNPARQMLIAIVGWHLVLLAFAGVTALVGALPLLGLFGAATSFAMISMAVVLLRAAAAEFRGRVMGVRSMAVYGLPLGLLLSGFLAERFGVNTALTLNAVFGLVLTLAAAAKWPTLWKSQP